MTRPRRCLVRLTGVHVGSERMHTLTNHVAEELTVLDVAPSRRRDRAAHCRRGGWALPSASGGAGHRWGVCADASRQCAGAPSRSTADAGQARAGGVVSGATPRGFVSISLMATRIVHLLSWHQVQTEEQLGEALAAGQRGRCDS